MNNFILKNLKVKQNNTEKKISLYDKTSDNAVLINCLFLKFFRYSSDNGNRKQHNCMDRSIQLKSYKHTDLRETVKDVHLFLRR